MTTGKAPAKTEKDTYTVETEVRVTYNDGTQAVEVWRGISARHAVAEAREHYRGVARADFASGEPW